MMRLSEVFATVFVVGTELYTLRGTGTGYGTGSLGTSVLDRPHADQNDTAPHPPEKPPTDGRDRDIGAVVIN